MDVEKAEHLNLLLAVVVFLLFLTFIIDHFLKNTTLSFSIGTIVTSLLVIFLLFEEIIGIAVVGFITMFVLLSIIFGSIIAALFFSSLVLGVFVLLTLLTR